MTRRSRTEAVILIFKRRRLIVRLAEEGKMKRSLKFSGTAGPVWFHGSIRDKSVFLFLWSPQRQPARRSGGSWLVPLKLRLMMQTASDHFRPLQTISDYL